MKIRFSPIYATIILAQICGVLITPAGASSPEEAQLVEAVAAHLEGVMDTSAQAAANPDKANVRMTTCRIQLTEPKSNSVYLYQEQALAENLTAPYRQRFLEIAPSDRLKEVSSVSYKPYTPEMWRGFCDRPEEERVVEVRDLGESVCSVFLKPLVSTYVGTTQPGGCPSNYRGATTITNKIILHDEGMDTWDRGFDDKGHQVWGAEESGYEYRWQIDSHNHKH
jgi:hypothetical protein